MTVQELIRRYAAGERDFGAIDLAEANLSRVNLNNAHLSRSTFSIANLSGANLNEADLSYAKLNVARLSGANLTKANLHGAILNVANMIRANLTQANLMQAALIRAEMIRADLTQANLNEANLNGADLREAKLDRSDLGGVNLSEADLRGATVVGANLSQANLNGTDLSKADLGGADLGHTELRHAHLHRANLSGASLRGANLRWADLSGADLRWADLSGAKLSGANLIGANLGHANLVNTSFVHADLTQANLMRADWEGADLSGAILTGAKLYGVSRFSLKTEGMSCEWIDLSQWGDRSRICRFTPEDFQRFFNQTHPMVQIIIDMPLTQEAHFVLARMYYHIFQKYPEMGQPPSIDVGYRQTTLTLRVDTDELLFPTVYLAMLPFEDAEPTQKSALNFVKLIQSKSSDILGVKESNRVAKLSVSILKKMRVVSTIELSGLEKSDKPKGEFFQAPTQAVLTNSSSQTLKVYHNPMFGKRFLDRAGDSPAKTEMAISSKPVALPPVSVILEFIQSFYSLDEVTSS